MGTQKNLTAAPVVRLTGQHLGVAAVRAGSGRPVSLAERALDGRRASCPGEAQGFAQTEGKPAWNIDRSVHFQPAGQMPGLAVQPVALQ